MKLPADDPTLAASLAALDERGHAVLAGRCSTAAECRDLAALYRGRGRRSARGSSWPRHNFGSGEYKYLRYPLPAPVASAAAGALPASGAARQPLARAAAPGAALSAGARRLSRRTATPPGQQRPTPLILNYQAGDYNCLHQDLYGELVFPLQATVLLSAPGGDFDGGEFLLVEQRPRMQSKGEVVPLGQGDAVIFAVNHRPVAGSRGFYRVDDAARRQPPALGRALHARHHLPRRGVILYTVRRGLRECRCTYLIY